jgi:hypothetical protein
LAHRGGATAVCRIISRQRGPCRAGHVKWAKSSGPSLSTRPCNVDDDQNVGLCFQFGKKHLKLPLRIECRRPRYPNFDFTVWVLGRGVGAGQNFGAPFAGRYGQNDRDGDGTLCPRLLRACRSPQKPPNCQLPLVQPIKHDFHDWDMTARRRSFGRGEAGNWPSLEPKTGARVRH